MSQDSARTRPFWLVTILYAVAIALVSAYYWRWFVNLKPDAWGNFLAGVFSPLAFLWLVYTAIAQKAELSLQREELSQNNATQREQQAQLQRQADALDAQAKLFRGQAAAAYLPIMVLHRGSRHPEGFELEIVNNGSPVVDLLAANARIIATSINGTKRFFGGTTAPLWEKGAILRLVALGGDDVSVGFRLMVTRLDLVKMVYILGYSFTDQRLSILDMHEADPDDYTPYLE